MDNGNDHVLQDAVRTATVLKYGISCPIAAADLAWQQKRILVSYLVYKSRDTLTESNN